MNLAKKTYLSMAMSVAMAGIGAPAYVGAVTLSQDLIGDVGIVPYYTMRDGWTTDFNIVNTGNNTVAAKVRFHEGRNSREVLDFIVVLSPYDQINFYAVEDPSLGPVIRFPGTNSEKTCVVPIPNGRLPRADGVGGTLPFSAADYAGSQKWKDADNYITDQPKIDRVREGYMTVIEMGVSRETVAGTVGYNANHDHLDCVAVENAFRQGNIIPTYNEFDRNQNNLKVGYYLTNVGRGTQGGDSATMLANFATDRSSIAHTAASIAAGGAVYSQAVAQLTAAQAVQAAAELKVTQIDATAAAYNNGDGCTFPPVVPVAPQVACPASLVAQRVAAVTAIDDAKVAVAAAQVAVDAATPGILGAPRNLIAAQEGDWERFPDLDSGDFFAYWFADGFYRDGANYDALPDAFNLPFGLWAGLYPRPVDAVTALLMKSNAINTWALNDVTGAHSDLVYTAPTKRFYTDWISVYDKDPHLNGISPILAAAVKNFSGGWPPFGNQFSTNGESCDEVSVAMFNNDEIGLADPVLPSPTETRDFCWEVNVLHTAAESVLGSQLGERLDPNDLDTPTAPEKYNGWVDVGMDVNAYNYHPALPLLNLTIPNIPAFWPFDEIVQVGMPYIGFNLSERDLGNPLAAYSALVPHSYMRNWDKRNLAGGTLTLEQLGLYGPVLLESIGSWFQTNPITPIDNR